ncbi:MAG: deoxyribodipyrimidine photo-lyase [Ilumatobacteraceae bacterium]
MPGTSIRSKPVVMWFRRDLRLAHHPALSAAAADGVPVIPLFVDDPAFDRAGQARRSYLRAALHALRDSMGGALVIRRGDPVDVVPRLVAETGATAVHLTRDYGPYGRRRDAAVIERLRRDGVRIVATGSPYAVAPGSVVKSDGTPYRVFTPFSRTWAGLVSAAPLGVSDVRWQGTSELDTDPLPESGVARAGQSCELPAIGEAAAHRRWEDFAHGPLARYAQDRNAPGIAGTSQLSADLRWGVIHPVQLLAELGDARSEHTYRNELAWREFYADVLFHQPETAWHNLNPAMDAMPVDTDAAARRRFDRWATGCTGYPIVDAGMRQLLAIGWMHNRVRMITASFLVKDLHLPWWWGARHFMRHLIDGDLASNNHGWQWTAGTGTDAAPYFRVFNPTAQSEKFDADGAYLRRWVPELTSLTNVDIHAPGAARPADYPRPMVDHAAERVESLRRYALTRS